MALPTQPVSLSIDQVADLNRRLSQMRHDINNNLSVLVAAVELVKYKPDALDKWLASIAEQPLKISESIREFSAEFEKAFGIKS